MRLRSSNDDHVLVCSQDRLCTEIGNFYVENFGLNLIQLQEFSLPGCEFHIGLPDNIRLDSRFTVVINLFNAERDLLKLCFVLNTLYDQRHKCVELIVPYLSYIKEYKIENYFCSRSRTFLSRLLNIFDINHIKTMDAYKLDLPFKVVNMPVLDLLSQAITHECVLVAPDGNMISRVKYLANAHEIDYIILDKNKDRNVCLKNNNLNNKSSNKRHIIIDDVLIAGGTVYQAGKLLRDRGILNIECIVSHCITSQINMKYMTIFKKIFTYNMENTPKPMSLIKYTSPLTIIKKFLST